MSTIRLIPSTYAVSSTSYLSVSNASNMYDNVDSTTYATITNTNASTSSRYLYIRGFNFSDIPNNAIVSSFTVKIKGYESGLSTSTSYAPRLANGTSTLSNTTATTNFGTSAKTITIPTGSLTWENIINYGSNFTIMVYVRRSNKNTTGYFYCYGAEIEVEYTIPNPINVNSILVSGDGTISPSGTTTTYEGQEYTLTITPTDKTDEVTVTKDSTDITEYLEPHYPDATPKTANLGSYTLVSGSFNGSGASYFSGIVGNGVNASQTTSNYYSGGSGTIAVFTYDMPITGIPSNAIIERVYCEVNGHAESTSNSNEYMCAQLISGDSELTEELNFKDVGTSNTTQTLECETIPTISELASMKLQCRLGYYGGAINGATAYVVYSIAGSLPEYYTYTFTVGNADTLIEVTIGSTAPYIPPDEDPELTYHSLTISSINATTTPDSGTTRVEEGTTQVVTIYPTDPQLTLALDNGVDITSQLVGSVPQNEYTVTTQVTGADYGFNLNSSTGYYVSSNDGVAKSASVARINMDFESSCLVTITYINYAEEDYDYGMFGKLDTAVATDGLTASSGGSTPSDSTSNYQLAKCSNTTATQTITYEVSAGQHFIDVKYGKDDASDSGNDSLQWKITSIEPTSGGGEYTYTLTNINQKHSLIFIFGDVTYYFITSSITGDGRIFPDGQQVVLPGDEYRINIVPDSVDATVTMTDNGTDVTSQLEQISGTDKQGNPAVSYKYSLFNIAAAHTLLISVASASAKIFLKINGSWVQCSKVYQKINGSWVEQSDPSTIFSTTANYVKMN